MLETRNFPKLVERKAPLNAYLVLTRIMDAGWTILPATVVLTALACTVTTMAFGFAGTWRALGQKAAAVLRSG